MCEVLRGVSFAQKKQGLPHSKHNRKTQYLTRRYFIMKTTFKQKIENLPKEILDQARFFTVNADKEPTTKGWSKPENQKHYNELEGYVGFDTAGHGVSDDYLFLDFDHIFNDAGEFVNVLAKEWYTKIRDALKTYCELSISKTGAHLIAKPTKGKFKKISSGKNGRIDFGDGAFLELFYRTGGRYCLFTGNVFDCEPNTPVTHGQAADDVFEICLKEITKQNPKPPKKPHKPQETNSAVLVYQSQANSHEFDIWRAEKMLEVIRVADLSREDWLNVGMALKNNGNTCAEWELWSRDDDRFKDGECDTLWQGFDGAGLTIATIADLANRYGYDAKANWKEWCGLHPEFKNQIIHSPAPMDDQQQENFSWTRDKIKSCPVNLRLPDDYTFSQSGIYKIVETKKETKYIPVTKTPIVPSKIFYDPIKQTDAYEISILSRGRWRHVEVDAETLGDAKALKFFCNYGALIIDNRHLKNFFASIIAINADMKETKAYSKTGWTDDDCTEFIYPTPDADFICRRVGYDFDKIFKPKGEAELWKQTFIEIDKQGGAVAHVAIGAALSSVVVKPLGLPNPQVHILGKSGIGKSALLKFAASIYGDPSEGALTRTFAATMKNQMETAVAFSDLPIVIDELETLNKRDEENLPATIYNFSLGVSNQAQHRNGTAREVKNFSAARITTGERPILKHNDKRGAYKRILNLRASELFEDAFATKIHNSCKRNHALFGATWIDFCTKNIPYLREKFDSAFDSTLRTQPKKIDPTQLKTLVNSLVCYMQFKLRIGLIDLNNADDIAKTNAEFFNDINAIIATLPTSDEIDDTARAIEFLKSFVAGNDRAFAHEVDKPDFSNEFTQQTPECVGKIFKNVEVAFLPHTFTEILEKRGGFASADKLREDFYDKGYLLHCNGKTTYPTWFNGKTRKMIRFVAGVLNTAEGTELDSNTTA